MDTRGPSHASPYGKACEQCFKSKCRCVARPGGDGCERCHRLGKQCRPSDSVRRRTVQEKQNSDARIVELEGKLNGLLSLLQPITTSSDPSTALKNVLKEQGIHIVAPTSKLTQPHAGVSESLSTTSSSVEGVDTAGPTLAPTTDRNLAATCPRASSLYPINVEDLESSVDPIIAEAEKCLEIFRHRMLPHFAVVHIPANCTAEQLRRDRPFLFRAIVAVAVPLTTQKLAHARELKRVLAQDMLLDNQSSIDLLLVMLAMSIVYDLRLNQPIPRDVHMLGAYGLGFDCIDIEDTREEQRLRTLERQRAILGCFFLSTVISSYFAQIDSMRWTSRMGECLRAIEKNVDCPTDQVFAVQVRLQLLAQKTALLRQQSDVDPSYSDGAAASSRPAFLYLNTLHAQLRQLRDSLPTRLQEHDLLKAHICHIELCINETAHVAKSNKDVLPPTAAPKSSNDINDSASNIPPTLERLECLWQSVRAVRSWFDVATSIPCSVYFCLPFHFATQTSRSLVVLYRLSTYDDPGWDRQAVRNTVDLLSVVDLMIAKVEGASYEAGEQYDNDIMVQLSRHLRLFRRWFSIRMGLPGEAAVGRDDVDAPSGAFAGDSDLDSMMQYIDTETDAWLEQAFGHA